MTHSTYRIAGLSLHLTQPHYRFRGLAPFETPSADDDPDLLLRPNASDPVLRDGTPDPGGRLIDTFDFTDTAAPNLVLRDDTPNLRSQPNAPNPVLRDGTSAPSGQLIDTFDFSDADALCRLWRTAEGYLFTITPRGGDRREVRFSIPDGISTVTTDFAPGESPSLLRFGLWMAFNIRAARRGVSAIHSSVVVHRGEAVLCLGESGTGKSTHTRLWREHIPGTELLNDDSPLLAVRDGRAVVYGSPWSGKTPCFRNESYPVRAFIRLSQAPENRIARLSVLEAYGALQPSFPPSFAHDEALADRINTLLSGILRATPVYHLRCLPDADAALLARKTLFGA